MIDFKELRITPEGNALILGISIKNYPYYDNMYISAIYVDTEDTYSSTNTPSSKAILLYSNEDTNIKSLNKIFSNIDLKLDTLNNHLLHVYVITDGTPAPNTPCGMDKTTNQSIVVDWYSIYEKGINLMKEVNNNCCSIPKHFIDFILKLKTIELAIKTGNISYANSKFIDWFKSINKPSVPCNCR